MAGVNLHLLSAGRYPHPVYYIEKHAITCFSGLSTNYINNISNKINRSLDCGQTTVCPFSGSAAALQPVIKIR